MPLIRSVVVLLLTTLTLTACGDKNKQHGERGNADRTPGASINTKPVDEVLQMPNYYNNVVEKCDGHGWRVFITSNKNDAPSNLMVVRDSTCGE